MQRLIERFDIADRAVASLKAVLARQSLNDIERDAAIQRFEYSFEATWKAAQRYLRMVEGIEAGSPKQVIRACFESGVFSEAQAGAALAMTDDRNLTVHTYHELLAKEMALRLEDHAQALDGWVAAMRGRSIVD